MTIRIDSRGSQIDTEKCVRSAGNIRFDMILLATARAREINNQKRGQTEIRHYSPIVSALLELQDNQFNIEDYIRKIK
jgi:DNA-directed RNA polymerase subunit K/omega